MKLTYSVRNIDLASDNSCLDFWVDTTIEHYDIHNGMGFSKYSVGESYYFYYENLTPIELKRIFSMIIDYNSTDKLLSSLPESMGTYTDCSHKPKDNESNKP